MSKRNAALEALKAGGRAPEAAAPAANVVPIAPDTPAPKAAPAPEKPAKAQAKVMLYLHPKVARKFKEMAFVENRKAHDIYLEALDLYLTQQGHGGLKGVIER
jgi:hypothetical protein